MGTKVDLDRLATTLEDYSYAYLMTTGENGRPHAVAVRTELIDTRLHVGGFGWRSRANALEQPIVALIYPPAEVGGYSLIVDGSATVDGDGLSVSPTVAVLHRPPHPDAPPPDSGCASDCQRLEYE
ncbi:hypothetical protein [Halofilum ochraceum]|uniref:hypothetical protein n=1 Tax=Halofilum ochraceum TaxID=1611323 RepID=UPI0008DA09E9|nr:hypothetical protein [Halofilum ochraceum]